MRDTAKLIPFTDDFMFSLVMRDVEICREFLELILPEENFGEIKITSPENPLFGENVTDSITSEPQKTMKFARDMHGVRFDVYIKSDETWAEIEMQTSNACLSLGKRSRFYHSNIDLDCLEAGNDYEELKKSYVIFICTFDYFGLDKAVYRFRNCDCEKCLNLDDFSFTIVINTKCSKEKIPPKLRPLFAYINEAKNNGESELVDRIDERVRQFSTDEWRRRQMTFEYYVKEKEKIAYRSGEEIGRNEGAAQKQREIAKNLKIIGVAVDKITEATGLSPSEVENL